MNETVIESLMESHQYWVCFASGKSDRFSLLNNYNCSTLVKDTIDPEIMSMEDQLISLQKPYYPIIVEFAFELLRYLVVAFLIAYIRRKLLVITRGHKLMSNAISKVRSIFSHQRTIEPVVDTAVLI